MDLAVGATRETADAWMLGDVLVPTMSVGAPPELFNQLGQDWSQHPWHPRRLAETGYAAFRDMLRTVLRGAGGIRMDHVLGLFRLWWIPEGAGATQGAYVEYDHEAMLAVLTLEAERAGVVVVGALLQIATNTTTVLVLSTIAILVASINIFGGFLVTLRMLQMFRKG